MTYEEAQEITCQPGKFEMCDPWVVLAWEDSLDGCWAVDADGCLSSEVTDADRKTWRLDPDVVAVSLYEADDGFISGWKLRSQS